MSKDIYLSGFARPLGAWSERALAQTWNDLHAALARETRGAGRAALLQSIATLAAEADRRQGQLTPDLMAELDKRGAFAPRLGQTQKRAPEFAQGQQPTQQASRAPLNERDAQPSGRDPA